MATIRYRKLNAAGDPLMGSGQANFVTDLDAVAQAISTRLKLFAGEWWENRNAGTPIFQSMLGVSGSGKHPETVALLLTERILSTPYVLGVSGVSAAFNPDTRAFQFTAQVQTQFGTLVLSNVPTPTVATTNSAPPVILAPDLSAPQSLVLSAGNLLTWNAQTGVTSWNVKRSIVSGKGYSTLTTVSGLTWTDTGATAGTTYYYVISPVAQGREGPNSNEVNSTLVNLLESCNDLTPPLIWLLSPGVTVLDAETVQCPATGSAGVFQESISVQANTSYTASVSIKGGTGQATLNISDNAFNYINGSSTVNLSGNPQTLSVTFNSGANTLVVFKVDMVDVGTVTMVGFSLAGPPPPTPPAPTGVTATVPTEVGATISWSAAAGATSYNVKRSSVSGVPYTYVTVGTTKNLTFTDQSATGPVGTTYYYVVTAVSYGAESAASSEVSIVTIPSITVNNLPSAADVTGWGFSPGSSGLTPTTIQTDTAGGSTGAFQDVSLTPNTTYEAKVTFYSDAAVGTLSLAIYTPSFTYITYVPPTKITSTPQTLTLQFNSGAAIQAVFKLDIAGTNGTVVTVTGAQLNSQFIVDPTTAGKLVGDMQGVNEGTPNGVPDNYGFKYGPIISDGNNNNGQDAVETWGTLYVDAAGNPAVNTRVNVRGGLMYWLRASTGKWNLGMATNAFDGNYYSEDFVTSYPDKLNFRTEPDGTLSFNTTAGRVAHWYAPWPRILFDPYDYAGVIVLYQARLIIDDPTGPDDRSIAKFLVNAGGDYYPGATTPGIENNPGIGGSKFKYVEIDWRFWCMTTVTLQTLQLYPPPIDLTGLLP